jgi:Na+/proline symporter
VVTVSISFRALPRHAFRTHCPTQVILCSQCQPLVACRAGVVYYTAMGGLRATFIASWSHVAVIYLALCIFTLTIYGTDSDLGSPARVYANLRVMENVVPVKDNRRVC